MAQYRCPAGDSLPRHWHYQRLRSGGLSENPCLHFQSLLQAEQQQGMYFCGFIELLQSARLQVLYPHIKSHTSKVHTPVCYSGMLEYPLSDTRMYGPPDHVATKALKQSAVLLQLDFTIVVISVVVLVLDALAPNVQWLKSLRVLRALKPLR